MQKFTFLFKTTLLFLFFFKLNVYSQTTYDFSSGLTIYKSSGSSNFDEAKFTVGGVEYKIQGGGLMVISPILVQVEYPIANA